MAEERLTVRLKTSGGKKAQRDIEGVKDEIEELDGVTSVVNANLKEGGVSSGIFSRGLRLLGTRIGFAIFSTILFSATLGPPLLGALALATAAAVALGGALIPLGIMAMMAGQRFELMKDVAGSAAGELAMMKDVFMETWAQAMAPGIDVLFRGIADAMRIMTPMAKELAPAFTALAGAATAGLEHAARGFAALGPEISAMMTASLPVIQHMGDFLPALTSALIHLAIAGMPVLLLFLQTLTDFSIWLGPAIDDIARFAETSGLLEAWGSAISWVATLLGNLGTILYGIYEPLEPFLVIIGQGLLWAFNAFGDAIEYVSANMDAFGAPLAVIVATLGALWLITTVVAVATGIFTAAMGLLNAVMLMNPFVLIAALLVGIALAIYFAYQKSETFRQGVALLWEILRHTPLIMLATWLWDAVGGFRGIANIITGAVMSAFNTLKPVIDEVIKAVKWVIDHADDFWNVAKKTPLGFIADQVASRLDGERAAGGPVNRGGAYLVGEQGPELFRPDTGGQIIPAGATGGMAADVPVQLVVDGRVLAETTHRVALRKKVGPLMALATRKITFAIEVDEDLEKRLKKWKWLTVRPGDTVRKICARRGHPEEVAHIVKKNKKKKGKRTITSGRTILRHSKSATKATRKKDRIKILVPAELMKDLSFSVLAGDEPPKVTDGYANFETIARPERVGITRFAGYNPFTLTIPIQFEAWAAQGGAVQGNEGQQIEEDIRLLERMAGRGIAYPGAAVGPPPIVRVSTTDAAGNVIPLIPEQLQWTPRSGGLLWRVVGIDWADGALRSGTGSRLRQGATVTLQQHTAVTLATAARRSASHRSKSKGKQVKFTPQKKRRGRETLTPG